MAFRLHNRLAMRRAIIFAALAAPLLATAQATPTTGQVTFSDTTLNIAECQGTGTTSETDLAWSVAFTGTIPDGSEFKVYAATTTFPTPSTGTANQTCVMTGATQVGDPITNSQKTATGSFTFTKSDIASASGANCSSATDVTVYVCVQLSSSGTGGTSLGIATGSMTLSTSVPEAPTIGPVELGDRALVLTWSEPSGAVEYHLVAGSTTNEALADPTTAPNELDRVLHDVTGITNPVRYRLDGLVNGVDYAVKVSAISAAGNEGPASAWAFGVPTPAADFAKGYHDRGGVETGGCSSGPAGLVALAAVAAGLALRRRAR